jgi:hypothetical protein
MKSQFRFGILVFATLISAGASVRAQPATYPDKIRGYKVERTDVKVKRSNSNGANSSGKNDQVSLDDASVDQLISLGKPTLARVTPLGITFEVPMVVTPVTQSGKVDFLVFEDMEINGHSVKIADYEHSFKLPNDKSLTLKDPLSIYIYLPSALLAALGEWTDSQDTWPVKGRVYVFGKFKKSIFSFKRCVPVELDLKMRNPLQTR